MTELHLNANPTDLKAVKFSIHMTNQLKSLKSNYIQPGFVFKQNFRAGKDEKTPFAYNTPSTIYMKFVNGYERTYHMTASPFSLLLHDIDYINRLIEVERAMQA